MSYWDSAYLAKFYLDEPESERVRALAESEGEASCSRFGHLETVSVFHRKLREGAVREREFRDLCDQFDADCEAGLWAWLPVTQAVLELSVATLRRLPKGVYLRSADALHLATASANGIEKVYSNDRHLLKAARYFDAAASDPAGS